MCVNCLDAQDMRARRHQATHHSPIHPASNSVAERTIGTLTNAVRAMLHNVALLELLWAEAFWTAMNVRNRTPIKALDGHAHHEMLYNMKVDLADLCAFSTLCAIVDPSGEDEENG